MPADLKNWGEAQQAGWQRTRSAIPDGFQTVMELYITQDRQSGHAIRLTATDPSQGQADQKALDAVNSWRRFRYGYDDTSKGPRSGQTLAVDQM